MIKKIKNNFPLDSLAYQYIFLLSLMFILPITGIVLGIIINAEISLKVFFIVFPIVLFLFTVYFYNPVPFLLTRVSTDENCIKLKRGKNEFEFRLDDVEEIAIVRISKTARLFKENSQTMKTPKLHFCISKKKDFFQNVDEKIRGMQKEYLVNNEQCLIPIIELEFFKTFLSKYNKEIINLEKYKGCLTNEEYTYLLQLSREVNSSLNENSNN